MDGLRVEFRIDCRDVAVDRGALRTVLGRILVDHGRDRGLLSVAVVDDAAIRRVNRDFLSHDHATDVISFLLVDGEEEPLGEDPFGEIVISAETALREARARDLPPRRELALYAIHGALHLVGHDDGTPGERRKMRYRERKYLEVYGV